MTQIQLLLLPAFVHVALIYYVLVQTGVGRVAAIKNRTVKLSDVDTNKTAYPERVQNFANNYGNQFELPMLYYAVLGFALVLPIIDWLLVVLSWSFVATRIVHTLVQTGKNDIRSRFKIFGLGLFNLGLMWGWLALRFFVIG